MAKDITSQVDQKLLEDTAKDIYLRLHEGKMRGHEPREIASRAFALAKAFAEEAQAVRDGKIVADPPKPDAPLYVRVHLWDGSRGQHGERKLDENNQPIFEIQPVDRYAFAPNLPDEHPVNQRYYPNAIRSGRLCAADGKELAVNRN